MDSCQRFKELVSDYIEGELDHKNQLLMEKHLRDCVGCEKNIGQLKNLIRDLHELPKISVSPDFETILRARISMESSLARHRRERWFPVRQIRLPAYALAAALIVLAVVTIAILNNSKRYAEPQANINNQWYRGGIEKTDPATNERYIYILETQPVQNRNGESHQVTSQSSHSDSTEFSQSGQLSDELIQTTANTVY